MTIQQINFDDKKETHEPKFTVAKEIALFSQETPESQVNSLAHKYKGIVDASDPTKIFNVVSPNYKIAQHDEVYDIVTGTVKEMGLNTKLKIVEFNDGGARMRLELTFPDISIKIGDPALNDIVNMRMAFDNSYNATTGLRGVVDGERLKCFNGQKVPENFARHYTKHTKGMDLNKLGPMIEKGIQTFQTKIKERWERYYLTKIDPTKARTFLEKCLEEKTISQKYLQAMIQRLDFGGSVDIRGAGQITNQWMLYNLVTEILTHECSSVDTQDEFSRKMDNKINASLKDLLAV